MMRPRLYVVDEPLANLDPATRRRGSSRSLRDARRRGRRGRHRRAPRRGGARAPAGPGALPRRRRRPATSGPSTASSRSPIPTAVKLPFEVVLDAGPARASRRRGAAPEAAADAAPAPTAPDAPSRRRRGSSSATSVAGYRAITRSSTASTRASAAREIVAVLGPNGSGKTTLFRTAMRLLDADRRDRSSSMAAPIAERDRRAARDRSSATSSRAPARCCSRGRSARSCCSGRATSGRDPATFDGLVADVLRRTSLDDLEDIRERPPLTLSFGQQKRLALAIALGLQPGDADPRRALRRPGPPDRDALHGARSWPIPGLESLYFVTHDVDLALTHADRILLFRDGRIVADGPPDRGHRGRGALDRVQPAAHLADAGERPLARVGGPVPRRRDACAADRRSASASPSAGRRVRSELLTEPECLPSLSVGREHDVHDDLGARPASGRSRRGRSSTRRSARRCTASCACSASRSPGPRTSRSGRPSRSCRSSATRSARSSGSSPASSATSIGDQITGWGALTSWNWSIANGLVGLIAGSRAAVSRPLGQRHLRRPRHRRRRRRRVAVVIGFLFVFTDIWVSRDRLGRSSRRATSRSSSPTSSRRSSSSRSSSTPGSRSRPSSAADAGEARDRP